MGAIVQSISAFNDAAGTTLGVVQGSNPTAGNFQWVVVCGGDATVTVADTLSNTYTEKNSAIEAALLRRTHHYVAPLTTGGSSNTVTATYGTSVSIRKIVVAEISGVSAYDVGNAGTDTGNNPTTAVTATNTAQPAFALAACSDMQGTSITVGTGYTDAGSFAVGGQYIRLQYKAVTNVASQSTNFANTAFDRQCTVFAIFTDAATSPTINTQPQNARVDAGDLATFTVSATTSGGALSYQWKLNGANVGTDQASYQRLTTGAENGALITVVVTDSNGSTTSSAAQLVVRTVARKVTKPVPRTSVDSSAAGWFSEYLAPGGVFDRDMLLTLAAGGGSSSAGAAAAAAQAAGAFTALYAAVAQATGQAASAVTLRATAQAQAAGQAVAATVLITRGEAQSPGQAAGAGNAAVIAFGVAQATGQASSAAVAAVAAIAQAVSQATTKAGIATSVVAQAAGQAATAITVQSAGSAQGAAQAAGGASAAARAAGQAASQAASQATVQVAGAAASFSQAEGASAGSSSATGGASATASQAETKVTILAAGVAQAAGQASAQITVRVASAATAAAQAAARVAIAAIGSAQAAAQAEGAKVESLPVAAALPMSGGAGRTTRRRIARLADVPPTPFESMVAERDQEDEELLFAML
jgi:hypothetical protein